MIKRNKEPMNVKHVAKMRRMYKESYKGIKWVPCIVCGDLCPQSTQDERYKDLDEVHLTCKYEPNYKSLAKKARIQRAEEEKSSLF